MATQDVDPVIYGLEMFWIYTKRVSAEMINLQPKGHRPDIQFICNAVRATAVDAAIST